MTTALPVVVVVFAGLFGTVGFVGYRISHPAAVGEAVSPSYYLLESMEVSWGGKDGSPISGLWIPGKAGASAVILAPGHGMSRSDGLSLAALLNRAGYHVLVYSQRGSGSNPRGAAWLGVREVDDMAAGLDFVRGRPGVDRAHVGVWGVDVGAYSALRVAAEHREVVAVAVDAAYEGIDDFVRVRLREDLGVSAGLVENMLVPVLGAAFRLAGGGSQPIDVAPLGDRKILFIRGGRRPAVEGLDQRLFESIRPEKSVAVVPSARVRLLSGDNLNVYDRQVAAFFQSSLSGRQDSRRPGN